MSATIIAFPRTQATEPEPDIPALLKRGWRAVERLTFALPSAMHPERASHVDRLESFIDSLEQAASFAEDKFGTRDCSREPHPYPEA
jgi:hypothetical protein